MSTFDVSWVQPQSLIWGELHVLYSGQSTMGDLSNSLCEKCDSCISWFNLWGRRCHCSCCRPFWRTTHVVRKSVCNWENQFEFAVSDLKTLWNSRLFMPSMIPQVNFSRLSLIQVEIHLSCWMNLRMKALIHNCIWRACSATTWWSAFILVAKYRHISTQKRSSYL